MQAMEFLKNLKQRRVGQWAVAYLAGAWLEYRKFNVYKNL
jgi:hypothetical protein